MTDEADTGNTGGCGPVPAPELAKVEIKAHGSDAVPTLVRHTVPVAAKELGISERGVRKRLAAGTLRGERENGKWYVLLPEADSSDGSGPGPDGTGTVPDPELANPELKANVSGPVPDSSGPGSALAARDPALMEVLGMLREKDDKLREKDAQLQALTFRNGYLESQLEEREKEVRLLTDSRPKPWYRRLFR